MAVKVYSLDEVTFNFSGIPCDDGRSDDEFVTIEQDEDNFTSKAGVDGEVTRSKNGSLLTTITLNIMQTSAYNDVLSAIENLDIKTEGGSGIAPLLVRDRAGTFNFLAPEAWIIKPPDWAFAREAQSVAWVFHAGNPERFHGGH